MKKASYNGKPVPELNEELAKLRGELRSLQAEKLKTGNAIKLRTARKNIARIMTALNATKPADAKA